MPRTGRKNPAAAAKPDVLEVRHHVVPDNAAAAGAEPIPPPAYGEAGITWRRMLRGIAIAEAAGMAALLVAGMAYGLEVFPPIVVAAVLFAAAAAWLPRMSNASVVYSLVVSSLLLLGLGATFGWIGILYPESWFEMSFAALTVLLPVAAIVAAIATLRRRDGADSARTPALVTTVVTGLVVLTGIAGSLLADSATRLPGDVEISASNMEFEQAAVTAKAGDVAIYFRNEDPFAHNVKIEGRGTSDTASGRMAVRHVFRGMAAGSYEFVCAVHPDMKGTLTVT